VLCRICLQVARRKKEPAIAILAHRIRPNYITAGRFCAPRTASKKRLELTSNKSLEPKIEDRCLLASFQKETIMGLGKGALLWLIGIPLPIIILLAVFMHH
jgi:hypothetical protein